MPPSLAQPHSSPGPAHVGALLDGKEEGSHCVGDAKQRARQLVCQLGQAPLALGLLRQGVGTGGEVSIAQKHRAQAGGSQSGGGGGGGGNAGTYTGASGQSWALP